MRSYVSQAIAAIEECGQDWRTCELQQQHEQEHSGYDEGDLTAFEEVVVSRIAVSEQKMCRWCEPYQSQEQGVCDKDNGCGRTIGACERNFHSLLELIFL